VLEKWVQLGTPDPLVQLGPLEVLEKWVQLGQLEVLEQWVQLGPLEVLEKWVQLGLLVQLVLWERPERLVLQAQLDQLQIPAPLEWLEQLVRLEQTE
jgi:hypothetical protein